MPPNRPDVYFRKALSFMYWLFSCLSLLWGHWGHLPRFTRLIRLALHLRKLKPFYRKQKRFPETKNKIRFQPKPEWVRKEIIRLKALMIHDGSRKIADTFNRHAFVPGVPAYRPSLDITVCTHRKNE
jgi:hypothetical protein